MSSKYTNLLLYRVDVDTKILLPYADGGIRAGFPSPSQDYLDQAIDLNKEIIKNPYSTFFGRVVGDSMKDAGLKEGDILAIDKSKKPSNGDMAVCFIDGEFTVKYIDMTDYDKDIIWLVAANKNYAPIKVTAQNNFMVWGIVTRVICFPPKMDDVCSH